MRSQSGMRSLVAMLALSCGGRLEVHGDRGPEGEHGEQGAPGGTAGAGPGGGGASPGQPAADGDPPAQPSHGGASPGQSVDGDPPAQPSHGGVLVHPGSGGAGEDAGSSGTGATDISGPQFACSAVASQQFDPEYMQGYSVSPDVIQSVDEALTAMDGVAKATQMLGIDSATRDWRDIQRSPDVQVPGLGIIRGYRYRDAGRGVNLDAGQDNRITTGGNFATVFPTPSIRAASWDLDLEKRVGAAMGDETAASRNNVLLAPCMNIIRHPYWGRTQETYGEDTYHIGRMATAFTVGLQEYVVGCAKHFAANNVENGRALQDAILNEQSLREVYGRHFEMVIQDGGVGCIMAAYNKVNGIKCTQNEHLLRDVLKGPVEQGGFGFQGLVLSDWWAMPGYQEPPDAATAQSVTNEAVRAGLDIEVPWTLHYATATLANAEPSFVEEAARRVLTQKFRFRTAYDTDGWGAKEPTSALASDGSIATNVDHEALAEEAAIKSAVLLANGLDASPAVLPLTSATSIAVVGPDTDFALSSSTVPKSCVSEHETDAVVRECTFHFATDPALGDRGSSRVNGDPACAIGPFDGIQMAAPATTTVTSGNSPDAAATADAVVVVVGYTPQDEGEEYPIAAGGDRSILDLPADQNEFVSTVLDLDKPTVIIVESGSIVNLPWLNHANRHQATIWAGYPGLRGGAALGKLIFGAANFSGKVPLAWPTQAELDVMPFKDQESVTTMGYFFGYREYDRRKYVEGTEVELVFPFGWGMSYSTFEYSNLVLPCESASKDAIVNVSVDITNTSAVDGDEVAMLFVKPPPKPEGVTGDRPWKELKSFARVHVPQGQTVTAHLPLRIRDLRRWEGDANGAWTIDSGEYTILVGKNAEDAEVTDNPGTLSVSGD